MKRFKPRTSSVTWKDWALERVLDVLFSRLGPLVTALVSTGLGKLVTLLATYNIPLDADAQQAVTVAVTGFVWWATTQALNLFAYKYSTAIQEAVSKAGIPIKIDGQARAKTAEAIEDLAHKAKRPTAIFD